MRVKLNNNQDDNKKERYRKEKAKFIESNKSYVKKISESRKKIQEEKEKIKLEKKNIRKNRLERFSKTKVGKFIVKIGSVFRTNKDSYSFGEVFLITIISLLVGAFSCFSFLVIFTGGKNWFILSKDLDKFVEVYETISNNYYDEVDKDKLIEEAINGMVSSVGDVYTNYADSEKTAEFEELVGQGTYEGIGCTIQLKENGLVVAEVFDDSPSKKAGLKVGDVILKVDDLVTSKITPDEVANYIKNDSDPKIKMVILRGEEEKVIDLVRTTIETPVVNSVIHEKNGKKIGYLSISVFSSNAASQFSNKLEQLEKNGIDSLIIDVRGNSGGYLTTVSDIVSEILPKGKNIYQVIRDEKIEVVKDKTKDSKKYPIAVLVNSASASASEILAAAVKESYGGYVVGTLTFGKGTVQQVKKLSDGSMIKYTIENWLTPNGNWIDAVGVKPTHEVELLTDYYNNPIIENDNQLQKALELVSE